jgi:hypothetical protein
MRNHMSIALVALTLGIGSVALPPTAGAQVILAQQISMYEARDIAAENGIIAIRDIKLYDGKWQIWGKDTRARNMKIEINARTGMVEWLDTD